MSDRTYLQMFVASCPSDQREALAGAISEAAGECLLPTGGIHETATAALIAGCFPVKLACEEVSCGFVDESAKDVAAAAPGAIWVTWEDPKYEWLGSWAGHHPDHGLMSCECAADGSEILTVSAARSALLGWHRKTEGDTDALVDLLFVTEPARRAIRAASPPPHAWP